MLCIILTVVYIYNHGYVLTEVYTNNVMSYLNCSLYQQCYVFF